MLLYRVLFQSYKNNVIKVISKHHIVEDEESIIEQNDRSEYCKEIISAIKEHYVFIATVALVK